MSDPTPHDGPQGSGNDPTTLWHGRFAEPPNEALMAMSVSVGFDQRLWRDDIAGSRAHVNGLARAGIIDAEETAAIQDALTQVEREFDDEAFEFVDTDEDIHTAIERRVTELAGAAGAKLHTGRSRNDQVATDIRLWCRRELTAVASRVLALQEVLLDRAEAHRDAILPGYTHLQRAQPVLLAHHLMAHGWALGRDVDRLMQSVARLDVSPLGAGALGGTSLPLDPATTADELGFASVFNNSLDAVSDRDFVAEALFDISLLAVHLSRLGEEWVLWTSEEFGFATLTDAFATGSSMLPQKKNADIAELARGKSGRMIGNLVSLLVTLKGLPLAYNRDLQEDKEPLFDSVEQISLVLEAMRGMIATARFNEDAMRAAASSQTVAAIDVAEWLVQRNVPFRQAHSIVGALVQRHLAGEASLESLVTSELGPEAAALLSADSSIAHRRSPGGGGSGALEAQLLAYRAMLADEQQLIG